MSEGLFHINRRKKIIFFLFFLLCSVFFYINDESAGILFMTLVPLHVMFLIISYRRSNYTLCVFFFILFISQGVNPAFFFMNKDAYKPTGFLAIGDFDFSLIRYYYCYSYIFIFSVALLLFSSLYRYPRENVFSYANHIVLKYMGWRSYWKYAELLCILLSILMSYLSIWMFNHQIGIVGLNQAELPYHMTGFLYHTRRIIISGLFVFLYMKSKKKWIPLISILVYSFISGVSSVSRSVIMLLLAPIILIDIVEKNYVRSIITIVHLSLLYLLITAVRPYVYSGLFISFDFNFLSTELLSLEGIFDTNPVIALIDQVSTRLYGGAAIVLSEQYQKLTPNALISYYTGTPISLIIPNMAEEIHGMTLPPDLAWGVGAGVPNLILLFSCHSYLYTIIHAGIVSFLLYILEKYCRNNLSRKPNNIIVVLQVALVSIAVLFYSMGESIRMVYTIIILSMLLSYSSKYYIKS